ncbi:Hypothetical predicted protein [Paramuricea clavata]|uniref:Uncharacterized protein n=1 Tax=Paramuricea clavata TaxID=317549 RepID=A0A6S7HVM2_PARCT|nr:Hypothetical predicted protein [Paramuricea clavata]
MERVTEKVTSNGHEAKPIFLPHCTWDKSGDILANSGGRSIGLFDELIAFFATMNMYSSSKMQFSDTKEYQDFLQMYTGKSKTRETVNFLVELYMEGEQTYVIEEEEKITNVTVNRREYSLSPEALEKFQEVHDDWEMNMCQKYPYEPLIGGLFSRGKSQVLRLAIAVQSMTNFMDTLDEENSRNNDKDNVNEDEVNDHDSVNDSEEASDLDSVKENDEETDAEEVNENDKETDGDEANDNDEETDGEEVNDNDEETDGDETNDNDEETDGNEANDEDVNDKDEETDDEVNADDEVNNDDDDQSDDADEPFPPLASLEVTPTTIQIAASIVNCSLTQVCILTKKGFVNEADVFNDQPSTSTGLGNTNLNREILLQSGEVVSMSLLLRGSTFRRKTSDGVTGKKLMDKCVDDLRKSDLVKVHTVYARNKTYVHFLLKREPPNDDSEELLSFIEKLAKIGINIKEYSDAYARINEDSERHLADYKNKKANEDVSCSPSKRPRL